MGLLVVGVDVMTSAQAKAVSGAVGLTSGGPGGNKLIGDERR